jgi:hypothetical protein
MIDFVLSVMDGYNFNDIIKMQFYDFLDLMYRASSKQHKQIEAMKKNQNQDKDGAVKNWMGE